jgi:hypothetical protein
VTRTINVRLEWHGDVLHVGRFPLGYVTHFPDAPTTGERWAAMALTKPLNRTDHATKEGARDALMTAAVKALGGEA